MISDRLKAALASRYTIERELGSGGMATVYLAEDLKHHRRVAVKVLRPEIAASLGSDRFFREIEVAARLQHPHILPLLDSGEGDGFYYYVMPYIAGESLRDRLAREGELPIHDAVKILSEVVDALAAAHAEGVVHRDIKPDNVMLSGRHALVTDFGVAKAVTDAAGWHKITETGMSLGTPAYMAPEQAVADPHIDHRADIYAVGVLGYELLTGGLPFRGATAQEVLVAHVTQPPEPISARRAAVPAGLDAVLMKCLEKRPADRWQTASELLQHLEPLVTPSGGVTPTQTQPVAASLPARSIKGRAMLVVGALVFAGAIGVVVLRRGPAPGLSLGRRASVTMDPGLEMTPAISPDGKMVAYSRLTTTGSAVMVQQLAGGAPVTVAELPPLTVSMPAWSPDGARLLYRSPRGLEVVPALGGVSKLLVPLSSDPSIQVFPTMSWGSWAPDGQAITYCARDTLFTRRLTDSAPHALATGEDLNSASWSPDGAWIAYVSGNSQYEPYANIAPSSIWVVRTTGGPPVRVTADQPLHASPVWLPGRRLLFVSNRDGGRDIYQLRLNGSGSPNGAPIRLTTGLNPHTIAVSSDGRQLVYSIHTETSNVYSLALAPGRSVSLKEVQPVTSGVQIIEGFSISTDGRWLVFDSNRSGNQDIWRVSLDGSAPPEPLTSTPEDEFQPAYSADGAHLAFHQTRSGSRRDLFVLPAGGGRPEPVRAATSNNLAVRWEPTGRALGYNCADAKGACIVRRAINDRSWNETTTIRLPAGSATPVWSPNGELLAYQANDLEVAVAQPDGGSPRVVGTAPTGFIMFYVRWASDGHTIYFCGITPDGRFMVYAVSPTGGPIREVAHSDGPSFQTFRFSMDVRGNTLYLSLADRQSDVWMAEMETNQ